LEFPASHIQKSLRLVYEIARRVPEKCPSRQVAVGASALLVVASAVIAGMAITNSAHAGRVQPKDICGHCKVRKQCKESLAR
jgi:hypothetical protein